jgi:lipopolysaccharide biosynthesis protein
MTQHHIAFYLPQFHPIPENDAWWGAGFTEWTNVAKGRPRFRGHDQPDLPGELGFYDLRLAETREAQAAMARDHGIDGFCYYHYWFGTKQLLERPFAEVLASGSPDHPFCLAWANENWTRSWDGEEASVLIEQDYDEASQVAHARYLIDAFRDDRYIRVDGKPLFLVYRASRLPDPLRLTQLWRDEARRAGVGELYLCRIESFLDERGDPTNLGFDASVEFAPDWDVLAGSRISQVRRELRKVLRLPPRPRIHDYAGLVADMVAKPQPTYTRFPCVTPGWDNTPRRRDPVILKDADPSAYQHWVETVSARSPSTEGGDSLVFVNAWNEWGEGAHLEPGRRWGRAFLEAHRRARSAGLGGPDG